MFQSLLVMRGVPSDGAVKGRLGSPFRSLFSLTLRNASITLSTVVIEAVSNFPDSISFCVRGVGVKNGATAAFADAQSSAARSGETRSHHGQSLTVLEDAR